MTDEEMQALDTQMKLQAMILMIRNLYAYIDHLEGHTGHVADGLRAFLEESLPGLSLPLPAPDAVLDAIKNSLAEPLRAVIGRPRGGHAERAAAAAEVHPCDRRPRRQHLSHKRPRPERCSGADAAGRSFVIDARKLASPRGFEPLLPP